MNILKETLIERIRNRLAPPNAVKVIKTLQRFDKNRDIEMMAAKEASEMVDRYKMEARMAIRIFRQHQTRLALRDLSRSVLDQETRLLESAARAKCSLYLDAKRDYHDLMTMMIGRYNPPVKGFPARVTARPSNDS